ncbi:hypothetical protein HZ326_20819 [Fusarium oxysporum f. sp. albedinis]|nr:Uncharacterized protein HZ326_21648 [Fusarium oxysporum f. sp. albedinis]KAJ0136191.1 hypothetical protein HZ326_20819 [Fusarium oxysporum f. sp. albedinis]
MPRGKELSPSLRSRICELRRQGLTHSQIKKHFPDIPLGTIKTTLRREAQLGADNISLPRSGAPRKLTEEQRDQIYDTVTTDPHITMRDLLDSVDNAVKLRSLRYLLREMNKRKSMQKKRVALTPLQARKRLDWAIRYQGINWRRVKWSDECMVRRGQGVRPIWTFLSPREALRVQDISEARRQGAVQQMFWAAFGHGSRTSLVPLVGNVNAIGIYDLYSIILPWFLQPGDIFMHDNASVHTARIVKALLEELQVQLMIWPPYSPDVNPIENLWALMKAEIYRLHPELTHAEDTVATQHALVLAAMEAWDNLEERVLKNLCDTMPNRITAIITAEGWYTKY